MKATTVRKRKRVEAPQTSTTSVKNPTGKTGRRRTSKTGRNDYTSTRDNPTVLPLSAVQMVNQKLSREDLLTLETNQARVVEPNAGLPLEKIKLQLFPLDEATRNGLEKDGHNPYLELTLRARKKISSVLKHLNNKWGSSDVAVGEVMLFPYNIQLENLRSYKRWSINDNHISAGDVYADIESPALFRLRYGWFSELDSRIFKEPSKFTVLAAPCESQGLQKSFRIPLMDRNMNIDCMNEVFKPNITSKIADAGVAEKKPANSAVGCADEDENKSLTHPEMPWDDSWTNLSIGGMLSDVSLLGKINNCDSKSKELKSNLQPIQLLSSDISIGGLFCEASRQGKIIDNEATSNGTKPNSQLTGDNNGIAPSPVISDNSFTTLSIGGHLSESSLQAKIDSRNKSQLQPSQLISDSLDSFTFDGIRSQTQKSKPSTQASLTSILDAEETCHAFLFGKSSLPGKISAPLSVASTLTYCNNVFELNSQSEFPQDHARQESKTGLQANLRVNHHENSLGLGGIKWTESLEPFDICLPSTPKIRSEDSVSVNEFPRAFPPI